MKKIILFLFSIVLLSCNQKEELTAVNSKNTESENTNRLPTAGGSCETAPYTASHAFSNVWSRTVVFPATGRFVEESHFVTTMESFPNGRLFANTNTENIDAHLQRSLAIYQQYDPSKTFAQLYSASYQKQWTPAEAGLIGQGSIGDTQVQTLTPEKEMWFMNMMWAPGTRPAIDTKFILSANGKKVVIVAGYETGPRSQTYLGGLTPETHAWLGTNDASLITVSYLKDQSTPVGPITCGTSTANNLPVSVSPANNATNLGLPVSFSFTSPVNANAFRIQVSTSNTGWTDTNGFTTSATPSATIVVNASITGTNFLWSEGVSGIFEGPKLSKTYYYTIRSFDTTTGTSKYTAVKSFTTAFGAQPISPSNATNVSKPITLSWTSTTSSPSYRLQISKVNSSWTATDGFTTSATPTTNVPVNYSAAGLVTYTWPNTGTTANAQPISGTTYYWTVRLFSTTTGSSKYSTVRSFTVN